MPARNSISLIFLVLVNFCFSQSILDSTQIESLKNIDFLPFDELIEHNIKYRDDQHSYALAFGNSYLKKAKNEGDTLNIMSAYWYLSKLNEYKGALNYYDSIFEISQKLNDKNYLSSGYIWRGNYYYQQGQQLLSLNDFIKADRLAKKNGNLEDQYEAVLSIYAIKANWVSSSEKLQLLKTTYPICRQMDSLYNTQKYQLTL